jgi:hypothetical protein
VKDGPQNYSKWHNEQFDTLVRQIDNELDTARRKTLIRQAEAILEQDPPTQEADSHRHTLIAGAEGGAPRVSCSYGA